MKSQVILLSVPDYSEEKLYTAIREGIRLLGGFAAYLKKEEKILLKPNLVRDAAVERAVITHPAIMEAVARTLYEQGYTNLSCGDSCGFGNAHKIMRDSGMLERLEVYGVTAKEFSTPASVTYKQGGQNHTFMMAQDVLEADALISVCKMKTHALEHITGAVKNQYGCICGLHKAKGHTIYPNADSFARMLIHLNQSIKPRLYIMDGVTAMEGNGPTSGDPVQMGVILMSRDPVALDSVFCHLIHLDPEYVPTNIHGRKMGLGTWKEEEIEILTPEGQISWEEMVKTFGKSDFRVDRTRSKGRGILGRIGFLKAFQKKPVINPDRCRKCGVCVESCLVEGKAVTFADGRKETPTYDYKKCIRCFCCQEMCPYKAIEVK